MVTVTSKPKSKRAVKPSSSSTPSTSTSSAPFGQPSSKSQSSRKSKSDWRKNIDLTSTESALENARVSERLGLKPSADSDSLFIEDRKGDSTTSIQIQGGRKREKKPLKSLEILSARSAVPAVSSRVGSNSTTKKLTPNSMNERLKRSGMSKKMKEKLIRLSGGKVKGPFGAVVQGENEMQALKDRFDEEMGKAEFDPWKEGGEKKVGEKRKGAKEIEGDWVDDVRNRKVKVPRTLTSDPSTPVLTHKNDQTSLARSLSSVPLPHAGQSYNPTQTSHEELLNQAYLIALDREKSDVKARQIKKDWEEGKKMAVRENLIEESDEEDGETEKEKKIRRRIMGMNVDEPEDMEDEVEDEEEEEEGVKRKADKRKTRAQKARAKRVKQEEQLRLSLKKQKKSLQLLNSIPSTKKAISRAERDHLKELEARKLKKEERARTVGMQGQRLGKFRIEKNVGDGEREVQTEGELSESLRGLKPEGNLFRDRFQRLQARGLAEARVPVMPKRKNRGLKEYETHAYRRFI